MKPKKNPFKVNHVRSIKLKNKAKAYISNLKNLKKITGKKIEEVDDQLKHLQEVVHQKPKQPEIPPKPTISKEEVKKSNELKKKEFIDTQNKEKEALDKLDNMEL